MDKNLYQNGFSLVEAVVVVAVSLIVLLGLSGTLNTVSRLSVSNTAKVQAAFLTEEGLEAVRILRDDSWSAQIAPWPANSSFYLFFDGAAWQVTTTKALIDSSFERKVTLSNIFRDSNQNIVSSGGTLDPNTKKVTVSVSWATGQATTTRSLSTYLTNIFNN